MWILILLILLIKLAYFETEVTFGLIWVNLQNGRFYLQISI